MRVSILQDYLESAGAGSVIVDTFAADNWEMESTAALKSVMEKASAEEWILISSKDEPKAGTGLNSSQNAQANDQPPQPVQPHRKTRHYEEQDEEESLSSSQEWPSSSKRFKPNDYGSGSQQELDLVLARSMAEASNHAIKAHDDKHKETEKNADLQTQLVRLECERKMEKADYERKVKRLTKKVGILQQEAEQLRAHAPEMINDEACAKKLTEELDRANAEKAELGVQLSRANDETHGLKSAVTDLCMELDRANDETRNLESAIGDLRAKLNRADDEACGFKSTAADLCTKLDRANDEAHGLKSTITDLRTRLDRANNETQRLASTNAELCMGLDTTNDEKEDLRSENMALRRTAEHLKSKIAELHGEAQVSAERRRTQQRTTYAASRADARRGADPAGDRPQGVGGGQVDAPAGNVRHAVPVDASRPFCYEVGLADHVRGRGPTRGPNQELSVVPGPNPRQRPRRDSLGRDPAHEQGRAKSSDGRVSGARQRTRGWHHRQGVDRVQRRAAGDRAGADGRLRKRDGFVARLRGRPQNHRGTGHNDEGEQPRRQQRARGQRERRVPGVRIRVWGDGVSGPNGCIIIYRPTRDYLVNGEMERWSAGEMECWRDGEMERWSAGEMERWSAGVLQRWSAGVLQRWSAGEMERRMERWRDGVLE